MNRNYVRDEIEPEALQDLEDGLSDECLHRAARNGTVLAIVLIVFSVLASLAIMLWSDDAASAPIAPLPLVCTKPGLTDGTRVLSPDGTVSCGASYEFYDLPGPESFIRIHTLDADPWANPGFVWTRAKNFSDTQYTDTCISPALEPGTKVVPVEPWTIDNSPCKQWGPTLKAAIAMRPGSVITGVFTASPASGPAPLTLTLAWEVKGPASMTCVASGSWTGSKAASGKQTITALTAPAKYLLTCSTPGALGSATVQWTPATARTDGTALDNLAGTRLLYGRSRTALTQTAQAANAGTTSYRIDGLEAGTWYFAAKHYDTENVESDASSVIEHAISALPGDRLELMASVSVNSKPNPPAGLVVTQPTAFRFNLERNNQVSLVDIGTVDVGTTQCVESEPILGKHVIRDRMQAKLKSGVTTLPRQVLAACGRPTG